MWGIVARPPNLTAASWQEDVEALWPVLKATVMRLCWVWGVPNADREEILSRASYHLCVMARSAKAQGKVSFDTYYPVASSIKEWRRERQRTLQLLAPEEVEDYRLARERAFRDPDEAAWRLEQWIRRLENPQIRLVFREKAQGWRNSLIARELGVSRQTVQNRLRRGFQLLRGLSP